MYTQSIIFFLLKIYVQIIRINKTTGLILKYNYIHEIGRQIIEMILKLSEDKCFD